MARLIKHALLNRVDWDSAGAKPAPPPVPIIRIHKDVL